MSAVIERPSIRYGDEAFPNFTTWVDSLATTDMPQARGSLLAIQPLDGEVVGYCCLGQGCVVAGFEPNIRPRVDAPNPFDYKFEGYAQFFNSTTMAPKEFKEWLGIVGVEDEGDIWLAVPEGMRAQGPKDKHADSPVYTDGYDLGNLSCIDLNDDLGLTFSQIADVLRYFGIRQTDTR